MKQRVKVGGKMREDKVGEREERKEGRVGVGGREIERRSGSDGES